MNNKIFYSLFFLCLLAAWGGCTMEPLPGGETKEGADVTVRFTASIPDYKMVTTRADAGVSGMWLLVFNESGNLIARREAVLSNQTANGGTFTVSLPASTKPRTVHFITNYNWAGFDDAAMLGASEAETVALLTTEVPTFWARKELNSGISDTSFANNTIELLRNRAKITVISAASNFTIEGFAVHNRPDKGTVAPYDANTGTFLIRSIIEPQGMNLLPAEESAFELDELYLFERKNATADNTTTVIVKGVYDDGNSQNICYYKIDLVDTDYFRYDIERNYHYAVTINSVSKAGYTNFSDALAGAAHNNIALDPIIEKFPMISDGMSILQVEKTLVVLTQPGESFKVWVKYFPDKDNPDFDNNGVTVEIQQGDITLNPNSLSFDEATGIITASASNQKTGEARIVVRKDDLEWVIRVILRDPFSFDPITINDENPGFVDNGQSQNAILRFNIPNEFPDDLFPLPIRIQTQGLYAGEDVMELKVEKGIIYYIYRATTVGEQVVKFKTNHSDVAETVTLTAEYFTSGEISYSPL